MQGTKLGPYEIVELREEGLLGPESLGGGLPEALAAPGLHQAQRIEQALMTIP